MKINWKLIILLLVAVVFLTSNIIQGYNNKGWKKHTYEEYSSWEFYDEESLNNGYGCRFLEGNPTDCKLLDTKENTEVRECTCSNNNGSVRIIATLKRLEYYKYNFETLQQEGENE